MAKAQLHSVEDRIVHAEAMSARYLGNYNEALAAGRASAAAKLQSQHWLDVANDLRGWGWVVAC